MGCCLISGCYPPAENNVSEEKNPYFQEGKARVAARDFEGAIAAFEKALEANPRSALAHFELGVLYEQNSDQTEADYINAMYHYQRAMKLRPNAYPHDNARLRLASCKRELVKAESLAPVYQSMQRELERLRDENQQLRKEREALLSGQLPRPTPGNPATSGTPQAGTSTPPPRSPPLPSPTNFPSRFAAGVSNPPAFTARPPLPRSSAPATRTHICRSGDTIYSVARLYRIRPEALASANPGIDPRRLRVGQTLRIPAP